MAAVTRLSDARRIVVKLGSALIVDGATGEPRRAWLDTLATDLAALAADGREVIVVSSGAIALGRRRICGDRPPARLEESQAAAAVGQIALAALWAEALGRHGLTAGQVLLTLHDTERRRSYLNARATLSELIAAGVVPVVNENDTVATTEIRYGDNDRLAARVATMAGADLLVLLSDIDGLYTAPPAKDPDARFIPVVERITDEIEAMAGDAGSDLSRGGMRTKIDAAKIATAAGTAMAIASGRVEHPLAAMDRTGRATWFRAGTTPVQARKVWILGTLEPAGRLVVDAGAAAALSRGKSLLPAGVAAVEGAFSRGDAVSIRDREGREIARGLSGYDAPDARLIAGKRSQMIPAALGYRARAAMVHRDDLVLLSPAARPDGARQPINEKLPEET